MKSDSNQYRIAKRLALKEYSNSVSQGHNGYLPYLDGILKNIEIISEINLGIVDIPLKKVKGTYTYLRSTSFARNFMPLMDDDTEFAMKWEEVYKAQMDEGLRDPIKVYEYLNWFYVIEGNKRVSVLKYLDVFSYGANVIRMIPKYDEHNKDIRIYYAFMKFYKNTGINRIWFSEEKSFDELWKLVKHYEQPDGLAKDVDRFKYFSSAVYGVFRKVYYELGGDKLPITTGDAFLDYIKINGVPVQYFEDELRPSLKRFIMELDYFKSKADIQTEPEIKEEKTIFSLFSSIIRHDEKVKVGFALAKDIKTSSWSYAHELGRMHLQEEMKDQVETISIDNVPESIDAYPKLLELVKQGCHVVFSTTPHMINATLKIAMEYPNVVFLNCSSMYSFKHVNTYFGRIHEARFLSGVVSGSMTYTDKLGYIATCALPEVISGVNAFALGARFVNPRAEIYLEWTGDWDNEESSESAGIRLLQKGVDIISHHNTLANRKFSKEFGVYTISCDAGYGSVKPLNYLAVPVWNWGIFYEKMIRNLLNTGLRSSIDTLASGKKQILNYWWGMDSGILDFFYSKRLVPKETQRLIEVVKTAIINRKFYVFTGALHDKAQKLRIKENCIATREEILSMDWLLDFVNGDMPECENKEFPTNLSTGKTTK